MGDNFAELERMEKEISDAEFISNEFQIDIWLLKEYISYRSRLAEKISYSLINNLINENIKESVSAELLTIKEKIIEDSQTLKQKIRR